MLATPRARRATEGVLALGEGVRNAGPAAGGSAPLARAQECGRRRDAPPRVPLFLLIVGADRW
eukprot:3164133-Prymnesium_polylepis.1